MPKFLHCLRLSPCRRIGTGVDFPRQSLACASIVCCCCTVAAIQLISSLMLRYCRFSFLFQSADGAQRPSSLWLSFFEDAKLVMSSSFVWSYQTVEVSHCNFAFLLTIFARVPPSNGSRRCSPDGTHDGNKTDTSTERFGSNRLEGSSALLPP